MKKLVKTIVGTSLVLASISVYSSTRDAALIKDMESLRDSLPFKDAGRPTLTRRLADLYFQQAVDADKDLILHGKGNPNEVARLRERAVKLYSEALDGEKGVYPAITGELKIRIHFQQARLERMSGKTLAALKTFQMITESKDIGDELRRESLLTVAEIQDELGKWRESAQAYEKALPLCQGVEAISYVNYRLAWSYFRSSQIERAQSEIAKALFDAKGNPKDQVIADYIQFLAATPATDGQTQLQTIEVVAQKTNRLTLVDDLGEAFFAIGNRKAGVTVFTYVNRLRPNAFYSSRLAEEYYGFRFWDELRASLNTLETLAPSIASLEDKKRDTVDKILRRLVVQLDGERKSNKGQCSEEVLKSIDIYLTAFPSSDVSDKMREGWLAAQSDEQKKIDRLALWISQEKRADKIQSYRQERAALALKLKNYPVIQEEALALSSLSADQTKKREWNYVRAKAFFDQGDEAQALGLFKVIADPANFDKPDKWAIQAQHLSLELFNRQKDYKSLASQAALWTSNSKVKASVGSEVAVMEKAQNEAQFEEAAALGDTPAALEKFLSFCKAGLYPEKSCANAKVLAIKLKDQIALVSILAIQKDETALAAEYERMGRFAEAARLQEKFLKTSATEMDYLKIALLYQLADAGADRARVLRNLSSVILKNKKMNPEFEVVLKNTFQEAGFTPSEMLRLPWSSEMKLKLSAYYIDQGFEDAQARKLVLSSNLENGAAWVSHNITTLKQFDEKQRAIKFYGANSRALYQRRMNAVAQFAQQTKAVLPKATEPVRAYLLQELVRAYSDLDREILQTPVPEGLEVEQIEQVQAALESLALPLREEAQAYDKLKTEQLALAGAEWSEVLNLGPEALVEKLKIKPLAVKVAQHDSNKVQAAIKSLESNPNDKVALESLKAEFDRAGNVAAKAYFTDRLAEMEQL